MCNALPAANPVVSCQHYNSAKLSKPATATVESREQYKVTSHMGLSK